MVTHAAPISIEQINAIFYVTGSLNGGFLTIQKAVDYVRINNGGTGIVVVVNGVSVADSIPAVTGGGIAILIWDTRAGNNQHWIWNGTAYVPKPFEQDAGYVTYGMPGPINAATTTLGYDPNGTNGAGTGNLNINANAGTNWPGFNLILTPGDGSEDWIVERADINPRGIPRLQVPSTIEIYPVTPRFPDNYQLWIGQIPDTNLARGMWIWQKIDDNAIDFQGLTVGGNYDQIIRLNRLGGLVEIGKNASVTESGNVNTAGGFSTGGMPAAPPSAVILGFDPSGTNGNGTGNIQVQANPGTGWPGFQVTLDPQDGSGGPFTLLRCNADPRGIPRVGVQNTVEIYPDTTRFLDKYQLWIGELPDTPLSRGMWIWQRPDDNAFDIQALTVGRAYDQILRLNPDGGLVQIGPNASVTETGDINALGNASFASVTLGGDPINALQAATKQYVDAHGGGGGGGMVWPSAGVGVSTGTSWDSSIDPATLPRLNTTNTFTQNMLAQNGVTVTGGVSPSPNKLNLSSFSGTSYIDFIGPNPSTMGDGFIRLFSSDASAYQVSIHLTPTQVSITPPVTVGGSLVLTQAANLNLTTTGNSGPATLSGVNLNIPQYAAGSGTGLLAGVTGPIPTKAGLGLTTAYNQSGTFTAVDDKPGITLLDTANLPLLFEGIVRPYPASAFTLTTCISLPMPNGSYSQGGIVIADTLAGKAVMFGPVNYGNNIIYQGIYTNSTPNTPNGNLLFTNTAGMVNINIPWMWLRIKDDGTNITYYISQDGCFWSQFYTSTKAAFYLGSSGFNYIGYCLNPNGIANAQNTLLSWVIS